KKQYPDFCVANYSPEHWKETQKVLTDCGIEIRFLLADYVPITAEESNNPKGLYVQNGVATVLVTDAGFETVQEAYPLIIKTRNIYRHVGKLNIFDSAELKPLVKYTPKGIKTSLFKKFLITIKAIIKHFR
ncbi:TPA: hypothetical protein NNU74_004471, partial [Salmonella enterica]|nr:hypothetical protein [Salmonella enterica]HCH9341986.1 hypothetical protein [Salmonella enterica]